MSIMINNKKFKYNFLIIVFAGCLITLLSFGTRASFGLFLEPISSENNWGRDIFAFAIAFQNLVWGIGQPIAGSIADRYGSAKVLAIGGIIYAFGVGLMTISTNALSITFSAGFLVGIGIAGASFTIVLAAVAKIAPPEHRGWALGMVTASGSLGQLLMVPLGQTLISSFDWHNSLLIMAVITSCIVPFALILKTNKSKSASSQSLSGAISEAINHRGFLLLFSGFFVCGFHVAFIQTHLPAYLYDNLLQNSTAAWSLALIGLFNIFGAYFSGIVGDKYSKKNLLSLIYFLRTLAILIFILVPITEISTYIFAAVIGILWLSTVPLTSGIVANIFGTNYLGTLFGLVFFGHQLGAFFGVWLGGIIFDLTGSYNLMWWICCLLGIFASFVNIPINEKPLVRLNA